MPKYEPENESMDIMSYNQLRLIQKLQLAWSINWPILALEYMLRPLSFYWLDARWEDEAGTFVSLFVVFILGPWVIRHVVRLNFEGFNLALIRHGSPNYQREMTYKDSLSVFWLLSWRPLLAILPFAMIYVLIVVFTGNPLRGSSPSLFLQVATNAGSACISMLLQTFWLNSAMTEKIYSNFSLVIRRGGEDQETNLAPIAGGLRIIQLPTFGRFKSKEKIQ